VVYAAVLAIPLFGCPERSDVVVAAWWSAAERERRL